VGAGHHPGLETATAALKNTIDTEAAMNLDHYPDRRQLDELCIGPIEGGWRVRETGRYFIDVLHFGRNWRIVTTSKRYPMEYERGWCYQGETLIAVVLRCFVFDPDAGQEPTGWIKEVSTERRACAWYHFSTIKRHHGYDPDCEDCGNERLR
jgi:hypothetical protein